MHILFLTASLEFGGAQNVMIGLARKALQNGYEVSFLSVSEDNDYQKFFDENGIECYSLKYNSSFKIGNLLKILKVRKALLKKIKELKPDIVHEHLFLPKLILYGVSRKKLPPFIQTQHDNSPWWLKKDVKSILQTHIEKRFNRKTCTKTVAISYSVEKDLISYLKMQPNEITVIYNFIDIGFNDVPKTISDKKSYKIFMITRLLWEKKGLGTALRVIADLKKRGVKVKFIVVGDGIDYYKMEKRSEELGLKAITDFRGFRRDIANQLSEADLLLMPSKWEGFGITAAEAAAQGVPVIASGVGGLQEVVIDGETGFICSKENVGCFVKSILKILSDKELYNRMSTAALENAKKMYSLDSSYLLYEKCYMEMVNRR